MAFGIQTRPKTARLLAVSQGDRVTVQHRGRLNGLVAQT